MGVLKLGRELDLALETLGAHAGRHRRRQDLRDDRTPEPHLVGEEHAAHPAPAELALERVSTAGMGLQLLAELGRHALLPEKAAFLR